MDHIRSKVTCCAESSQRGLAISDQHYQTLRNLFSKRMSGHRFDPPLEWHRTDGELGRWLGEHNSGIAVFRNSDWDVEGVRLACQCESCWLAQLDLCVRAGVDLIGSAPRATSFVHHPTNCDRIQVYERGERSELEEQVELRKQRERERDIAEKRQILNSSIQYSTGGLVKDRNGRVWTRNQLIAMCERMQQENYDPSSDANDMSWSDIVGESDCHLSPSLRQLFYCEPNKRREARRGGVGMCF
jgi:hypothetical protein